MASVYSFQFLSSPFYSSMPLTHHSKSLHFKTAQCSQQNELDKTLSLWVEDSEQSDTRRRETLFRLLLAAFSSSFISSAALAIGVLLLYFLHTWKFECKNLSRSSHTILIILNEPDCLRLNYYIKGSGSPAFSQKAISQVTIVNPLTIGKQFKSEKSKMNPGKPILALASLFIVLILNSKLTAAQEVEDQREFDYVKGSGKGPENWGDIHHEWASCKNGSLQSPIDLLHERVEVVPDLGKVKRSYRTSNAILKNRGHDLELLWKIGTAGSIQINGTDYALEQCHWHSPSEHTINGHEFALELHMVHRNLELNKTAVIGVLFNIGRPDKFLTEIEKEIKIIADSTNELNVGMINPKHIMLGGPMYYRYLGSLTTPPCTEGVIWTINKRLRTVSAEQIKLLRTAVHDDSERNARPLQLLNDRDILFYDPKNRPLDLNN